MLSALRIACRTISTGKVNMEMYNGVEFSLEECRMFLTQFGGGQIDLHFEDSGIVRLCIKHPETRNSITGKMMVDLEAAVEKIENWECGKGLLIYGADSNFCSGGDLNFAKQSGNPEGGYKMATFMQNVFLRIQRLPMISVAYIQGSALGGGAEMAMSCDYRVFCEQDSSLGFVHGRMGIVPAWGGLTRAVQMLGYRTALDLVTTARVVRAEEAVRLGLCDAVVSDSDAALAWLAQHTQSDVSVVRAAKSIANHTRECAGQGQALEYEKRVFAPLWGGQCPWAVQKILVLNRWDLPAGGSLDLS